MATHLIYMEDFNLLEAKAKVESVLKENDRDVVVLDQTIFYPQGGGQPFDQGVIESSGGKFLVEEVRFVEGVVKHIGKFESGNFSSGEEVRLVVDKERRDLNSRNHSAGHLVDMAVKEIGLTWIPGKGYHFPDGPYVEYMGSLEGMDKDKVKADMDAALARFIAEGRETKVLFMNKEEMASVCNFVPTNIPEGKPGRVVMYGDFGVPCGGTHVKNISDIKGMTIRKIKQEGPNVRVAYEVAK